MLIDKSSYKFAPKAFYMVFLLMFFMLFTAQGAYPQDFGMQEKLAPGVFDAMNEWGELLLLIDSADIREEAGGMGKALGLPLSSERIVYFKAARYGEIKRELMSAIPSGELMVVRDYGNLPVMSVKIKNKDVLGRLIENPRLKKVYKNEPHGRFLLESLPLIKQPEMEAMGNIGAGTSVAVLDTGVDYASSYFGSCAVPGWDCRVVYARDFAVEDGVADDSGHGTNVAGIILGVAPGTKIISLDVFAPDGFAYTSDILGAYDWAIENRDTFNITALNLSFGSADKYTGQCAGNLFDSVIEDTVAAGIISVVSSGNSGWTDGVSSPACAPSALSVGAVYDSSMGRQFWPVCADNAASADTVACFSNSYPYLSLLAPGAQIAAAGYTSSGTSQAAPHVSGAVAVLRGAFPEDTTEQTMSRLKNRGKMVLDSRNNISKPRLDLIAALRDITISGSVKSSKGYPMSGVEVSLSGDASFKAFTDALGNYAFTGLKSGKYTVAPKRTAAFIPESRSVTISAADASGLDFVAAPGIYSISGTISNSARVPMPGVTVVLSGASAAATVTDARGVYSFAGLDNGAYVVTPSMTGFSFIPQRRNVSINGASVSGQNFTAQAVPTFSISGNISLGNGSPLQGVTISLSGAANSLTSTNASGNYSFTGLQNGNYTLVPSLTNYTFSPLNRNVAINGANSAGQNFTATAVTRQFTLSVVDENGNPVSGFRWLLEEDTTNYSVPGLPVSDSISVDIHKSYAPVVAKGASAGSSASISVPAGKRYFVTVLPDSGYTLNGALVDTGQSIVTALVHALPIPTAQISVLVFHDINPINNIYDAVEAGLPDFKVVLFDILGQVTTDGFGNPLGTTYVIDPGTGEPVMDMMGNGVFTDSTGHALVKNLAPGKYGVRVVPVDGLPWVQTSTIEGTPTIDAWVRASEPAIFIEGFGTSFTHVAFGFVNPGELPWALTPPGGSGTITGRLVYNHFSIPPLTQTYSPGPPVDECWVGLNDLTAVNKGLIAAPCDANGNFTFSNVPPGTYQLVTWDKPLDSLFGFHTVTVPQAGGAVDMGDVLEYRWFGTLEGSVFYDENEDGFRDAGEMGIPNQAVNIRFRNGSIYQGTVTDPSGNYSFAEVFPFFKWLVTEVDYARFKPTGYTAVVDAGGNIPGSAWPALGKLNPQIQADGKSYRTVASTDVLQGMHLFLGQTNLLDWGKVAYPEGENGGISGVVFYAVTRAEDDLRYAAGDPWEPGIPRVQVNLYNDLNADGIIDSAGAPVPADVDNYPFDGPDSPFPGTEDIDRNGNGVFDLGSAIAVTHTDSWDDNMPTGCIQTLPVIHGQQVRECYDNFGTWNQIRPAVFDGGYLFAGIPTGTYIVEVVPPPFYELVKEEDKNVDFGEQYVPAFLPPGCVGDMRLVPPYLTLFPNEMIPSPYAGQMRPLCDRKQVVVVSGKNAASDFHIFTEVPKAARVVGFVNNDLAAEFNVDTPNYGEKAAPAWIPLSFQDYAGNEIVRVYTDEFGSYNALLPSTYTINAPAPSGVAPNMITICLNHPLMPDPNNPGQTIPDPYYDPAYSQTCWTTGNPVFSPGQTVYFDTPLVPVAAFAGYPTKGADAEFADGTPVISAVNGPNGGPLLCNAGDALIITSIGPTQVANPDYDPGVLGSQMFITRDFGFGATTGNVTVGGALLEVVSWSASIIQARAPVGLQTGQLIITRGDNNKSTPVGITLTFGECGATVKHIFSGQSIQAAVDSATPGDLIIVHPGSYAESVILYKPVRLQGSGAATIINANPNPTTKLAAWYNKLVSLGYDTALFMAKEFPGVLVLGDAGSPFTQNPQARIDGFTITGSLSGGGIFADTEAHYLQISNNSIRGNQGTYGGGISLGTPDAALSGNNTNVTIRNNQIVKNSGIFGGGGVSLFSGSDNYSIINNVISGNFSRLNGGGIEHYGLSNGGRITNNTIALNEVFFGGPLGGDGGGIFIGGEAVPGALTDGAGNVTILSNLIQGNLAGSGSGGSIRALNFNGQDVAGSADPADWYSLDIYNNMIVNNVAAYAGGGIALQDAAKINIINNTIANNDSTSTTASSFPPMSANSAPHGAGVVSNAHSALLAAASGQSFSDPALQNNIIWHNGSFYYDSTLNGGSGGLVPRAGDQYWDLQVTGADGFLSPGYCVLSSLTDLDTGHIYGGTNSALDPGFIGEFTNELVTAMVVDEGGNSISVRYRPVTLTGDYHLNNASPAINAGTGDFLGIPELQLDYDLQIRPNVSVDIGADEYYLSLYTLIVNKAGTGSGTVTSSPAGIDCGIDCSEQYTVGTPVILTAVADPGSVFAGWSGGGCSGLGRCTVVMNASYTTVSAAFNLIAGYNITGSVKTSSGLPIAGVTVNLSGGATGSAITDSLGNYSFTNISNGAYTLTPVRTGYAFTPVSRAVNISGADVTGQDFIGAVSSVSYSISGRVRDSNDVPVPGVSITVVGPVAGSALTDALGQYTVGGLSNGVYTVTPAKNGFGFTPASRSVTINNSNITGQDFKLISYSISGTIRTSSGSPLEGVTVTLTGGASATTTTDGNGSYRFTGLGNGAYTVAPSRTGYTFTPSSSNVQINGASIASINFTANSARTPVGFVSGSVRTKRGSPVSGVTVVLGLEGTGLQSTDVTDAFGNYRFIGLEGGAYTLTPGKEGYLYTPEKRSLAMNGGQITGIDFTAFAAPPARAGRIVTQCPGDTNGDGVSDDPRIVCMHVAAGDGFINMADGYPQYIFGFSVVPPTVPLDEVMSYGMLKAEFPAPTITVKEGQQLYLTLTNVGMVMRPDLFDAHTIHWHGFANASPVFDGEPMSTFGINMMSSLTYYYSVAEPGTYMYHCHMEATEHMQMGMLGNLYVTPLQDELSEGTALGPFVHHTGYKYAYNDGDGSTYYDVAYPIQIHAFDPNFHDGNLAVQPPNFAGLEDKYWMLNGRGYPDTINPAQMANSTTGNLSQNINSIITAAAGQKILLRISNLSFDFYTLSSLGIPMKVIGKDAKLLRSQTDENLYYTINSIELGGGQSADVILDTSGVAPGTYFLYSTNMNTLNNNTQERGGMMTEIVIQ
jgi:FtsP/CotA-like multicopper oxidase with cupredoxin domain